MRKAWIVLFVLFLPLVGCDFNLGPKEAEQPIMENGFYKLRGYTVTCENQKKVEKTSTVGNCPDGKFLKESTYHIKLNADERWAVAVIEYSDSPRRSWSFPKRYSDCVIYDHKHWFCSAEESEEEGLRFVDGIISPNPFYDIGFRPIRIGVTNDLYKKAGKKTSRLSSDEFAEMEMTLKLPEEKTSDETEQLRDKEPLSTNPTK